MAGAATIVALGGLTGAAPRGGREMFGLIGKMRAAPDQRDALIDVLLDGIVDMPGCLSYVVAKDPTDEDTIWITEVWDSKASHQASLSLPSVRAAITKAKPMIATLEDSVVTTPIGGHGLTDSKRQ
jgi:quinol monooxygenase YgiN